MRTRTRSLGRIAITTAALTLAGIGLNLPAQAATARPASTVQTATASTAAAVTWNNRPKITHVTDIDDCTSHPASIDTTVQWQTSSEYPDTRARVSGSVDIIIKNQTDLTIQIAPNAGISYDRLSGSLAGTVSTYHYGSSILLIAPGQTKTLSASAADRWKRYDGTADSNASPAETPILVANNPALEFYPALLSPNGCTETDHDYNWYDEIAWDATR